MKKMILALAAMLALPACTVAAPDPGQEGVLVSKPMFFGHGGVQDTPVTTGRSYAAITTDVVYVDVKPVEYKVEFNDLMSKDGVPLHFDASIVLQVTDSVKLVKTFGPKWFENNVDSVLRNYVRQAVRTHGMNEMAIDTSAIDAVDRDVNTALTAYIQKTGLPVKLIRMTVGKANPPDAIKDQRVETAQQEQRQKTESMKQQAEVSRKAAELARAEADNAYRAEMQLSPAQFVQLKQIEMLGTVCKDGNCTFIQGGNATALVQAK